MLVYVIYQIYTLKYFLYVHDIEMEYKVCFILLMAGFSSATGE